MCPLCGGSTAAETRFGPVPLARCASCGFTFLTGEPDQQLYGDDYFAGYVGGDYLAQEAQRRSESRVRLRLLRRYCAPPARLLEVGSAAGFFLDEARRLGYEGTGFEPNESMAAHARDALNLDVRTGTIEDAEAEPGAYDAACAFHVVEHVTDPLPALNAVVASVRAGGHVLVEVPNAESAAARHRGASWGPLELPHHVNQFGPRTLRTLLERAGLEVVLIDSVTFAFYNRAPAPARWALGLAEGLRARALLPPLGHPSAHQLTRGVARRPER